jgi:hypothetical protein
LIESKLKNIVEVTFFEILKWKINSRWPHIDFCFILCTLSHFDEPPSIIILGLKKVRAFDRKPQFGFPTIRQHSDDTAPTNDEAYKAPCLHNITLSAPTISFYYLQDNQFWDLIYCVQIDTILIVNLFT